MTENQPKRVANFPNTGMRQFASFDRAVGPEEAQRFRTSQRARLAEEERINREVLTELGLTALLETPEDIL